MIRWKSTYRWPLAEADQAVTSEWPKGSSAEIVETSAEPDPNPHAAEGPGLDSPAPHEPAHAHPFPPSLAQQAAANAGGWVYDLDPGAPEAGPIPLQTIIGAWRIGDDGVPTGEFVANTHYRSSATGKRRSRRRRAILAVVLGMLAIAIVAAVVVFLLTRDKSDKSPRATVKPSPVVTVRAARTTTIPATHRAPTPAAARAASPAPRSTAGGAPATVRLEVMANERVWVCVESHTSQLLVDGRILPAGGVSAPFMSSSFRVFLGNGGVSLRVNGHVDRLAASSDPVAYRVSTQGVAALPGRLTPPCA
jgi:hypothetical protein